jgi:hypothetical protein
MLPVSALADPRGAGPRGAADPVNIGFRHFGKLEIDDMRDAVDVETARRDVGCDEGADAAAAKRRGLPDRGKTRTLSTLGINVPT